MKPKKLYIVGIGDIDSNLQPLITQEFTKNKD